MVEPKSDPWNRVWDCKWDDVILSVFRRQLCPVFSLRSNYIRFLNKVVTGIYVTLMQTKSWTAFVIAISNRNSKKILVKGVHKIHSLSSETSITCRQFHLLPQHTDRSYF